MKLTPCQRAPAVLLLLGSLLMACTANEDSKYARRGRFAVGTRELVITGGAQTPPLPSTLWYPAVKPKGVQEEIIYQEATEGIGSSGQGAPIKGHALADAAPDPSGGMYPLVVFSPCTGLGRMVYAPVLEHLASHGFIILAVGPTAGSKNPVLLSRTVQRAIDFAEALTLSTSPFLGLIDTKRTAVAGHSDGAFTSLLVGGARINMAAASALCDSNGPHTAECSGWISEPGRALFAQSIGLPEEPTEGLYPNYGDPRVKALLPMAAGGEMAATLDLSAVTMPTLLMIGSSDRDAPLWGTERIYQNLAAPQKAKVVIVHGGHALYCITKSDVAVSADTAGLDADLCDPTRAHAVINHLAAAFLLDVLKGDPEAHQALLPEAVKFEGIQYATTWK